MGGALEGTTKKTNVATRWSNEFTSEIGALEVRQKMFTLEVQQECYPLNILVLLLLNTENNAIFTMQSI